MDVRGLSCKPNIYVSWSTSELRMRLAQGNQFKPFSKKKILTVPRWYFFFCGSFVLFTSCVCYDFASVHCCLVITCWVRADLLVLFLWCFIVFSSLFHVVFWVRCGTWLYWFLIIAAFLTLNIPFSTLYYRKLLPAYVSTADKSDFVLKVIKSYDKIL